MSEFTEADREMLKEVHELLTRKRGRPRRKHGKDKGTEQEAEEGGEGAETQSPPPSPHTPWAACSP